MSARKITVVIEFYGDVPDDESAGDQWADDVGDFIVTTLNHSLPNDVWPDSFALADWRDEPELPE